MHIAMPAFAPKVIQKKAENTQAGRKPNTEMMENFQRACDWLESEIVLHSVEEIQEKMKE